MLQSPLTATLQSTLQSAMKMTMLQTAMKLTMLQRTLKIALLQCTHVETFLLWPQNHLQKKKRTQSTVVSEKQPGAATEHADYSPDDCDEALPPATVADAKGKKQMFTKSLAH
jgi:hypothetical protein